MAVNKSIITEFLKQKHGKGVCFLNPLFSRKKQVYLVHWKTAGTNVAVKKNSTKLLSALNSWILKVTCYNDFFVFVSSFRMRRVVHGVLM